MGCGAAAGLVAAGVGAAGAIGGALISSKSAKGAAQTQADAANNAADIAHQQYLQTRADLLPYNVAGQGAVNLLSSFFGGGGVTPSVGNPAPAAPAPAPAMATGAPGGTAALPPGWTVVPGYTTSSESGDRVVSAQINDQNGNFVSFIPGFNENTGKPSDQTAASYLQSQGLLPAATASAPGAAAPATATPSSAPSELQFLENTPGYQFALSQGLKLVQSGNIARGISGAALKGAANFATGLAQNTYQANLLNPLEYLGTLGEGAASQTGTIGAGLAGTQGSALVGGANALAAGQVGSANALSSGLNSLGSLPTNYLLYNNLLSGGGGNGVVAGGSQPFTEY
jgi:hypothetical protein